MEINSGTNSIIADIDFWAKTDGTLYTLAEKIRNANLALDRVTSLIMRSDTTWEWDDSNNTDLPIAVTNLVAGQLDYSLSVNHLKIVKVRIKDRNGVFYTLDPINRRDLSDHELNATGTPRGYDKIGMSIMPYPVPDYSQTAGIEVQFQRVASYFTTDDTTKEPGFAPQFHRLIPLYAALDYCETNGMDAQSARIRNRIERMEVELVEFYSSRDYDKPHRISFKQEDWGQQMMT